MSDSKIENKSVLSYRGGPNYQIMGNLKKPEILIDFKKVPLIKDIIKDILKQDRIYWESLKEPVQGIEKFNLLHKVCTKLPINSNVFEIAVDELIVEQIIVPHELDNITRYLMLCF